MTSTNKTLQARAGRNIGVAPSSSLVFGLDAASPEVQINRPLGSETVIMSCPEGVARTPHSVGAPPDFRGLIVNNGTADFHYALFFEDTQGNRGRISDLTNNTTVSAGSIDTLNLEGIAPSAPALLVLNPGEKIVMVSTVENIYPPP